VFQVGIAYLLWLFGGFGVLGLHRFYLRKVPTGVLWLCTGGVFFLGALYDFFTLGRQVAEANGREAYLARPAPVVTVKREKEPLERVILKLAQGNGGRVTPVQVAAASDWSLDEAQKALDGLVRRRVCEIRVAKSGTVVYHFAEFDPSADQSYEV
jgi:TM2 domain-containing membrane protein YozV